MVRIALLLFDAVDLIDVSGPYEVVLTANRLAQRRGEPPPFEVVTASRGGAPATAYGGLGLVPDVASDDLVEPDVLIVPGAIDVEDADELGRRNPTGAPDTTVRWVDTSDVITAGGMTSGIAATLHLVERFTNRELADATARQMDYVWRRDR